MPKCLAENSTWVCMGSSCQVIQGSIRNQRFRMQGGYASRRVPAPLPHDSDGRARPMRADALRNRRVLLDAARAVFQRDGLAAQMDDIAACARLGVGTLYRHFPTKEALIEVMIQERVDRL